MIGAQRNKAGAILAQLEQSPKAADKAARKALKAHPSDPDLLFVSGLVALRLGKPRDAGNAFLKAINTGRAQPVAYENAAIARTETGEPDKAMAILARGLDVFPDNPSLRDTAIKLAIRSNRPDLATQWADAALAAAPDDPAVRVLAGLAAEAAGELILAIDHFQAAAARQASPATLRHLARLLAFTNQGDKALACAQDAFRLAPGDPACAFDLAWREVEAGQFAAARDHFAQVMNDPELGPEALRMLATLPDGPDATAIVDRAEAMRAATKSQVARGHLELACYTALRATDPGRAFPHLTAANAHFARERPYDARADRAWHQAVLDLFDQTPPVSPTESNLPSRPIFILGMVRTGTTLLDRLVSAAPDTKSLGEVAIIDRFFRNALETPGTQPDLPDLARRYSALQALGAPALATIDKMPANYMYIGWLNRAFPDARIILMQRDPRDTAVSAFENHFNTQPMNFTFREDWIAQKFDIYNSQIAGWEERGAAFLKVDYEKLVTAPTETLATIAGYCGLADTPDPGTAAQPENIRTASFLQARQALGDGSVGRWRRYRDVLPNICLDT